jgi:hypothetical protein
MANRKAEMMLVLGAILSFVGPALNFVKVTYDQSLSIASESQTGYDTGDSSSYVIAGVLAIIALVGVMAAKSGGLRKGMAVLAILGGAFGLLAGIIDITGDVDIDPAIEQFVEVSTGIGTYVVTLGAILILVGGFLLFKSPATDTPATPAAPPAA